MKKVYKLSATVTISIYTDVEASSLEEAIELSKERTIEPYNYGDSEQQNENWIADGYDGEPLNIKQDE